MEDEKTIREVTRAYLEDKNYQVTPATHGREAIQALTKTSFDLAILDIMPPFVSGLDVLAYIKKESIPLAVIMLTALDDEQTQLQAFELYADDYVTKPFSPKLLLKRVEAVLRRYEGNQTATENRDLVVDRDRYHVYWNGACLQLSLTEFLIFEALYTNPSIFALTLFFIGHRRRREKA